MQNFRVYNTVYQPLKTAPLDLAPKVCDQVVGTILETQNSFTPNVGYIEAVYVTNTKKYTGWVKAKWLEPYNVMSENVITIKDATPSPNDLGQYLIYKDNVQYNLCGPFSVMYAMDFREMAIEEWLDSWAVKAPPLWKRIFPKRCSTTTGVGDLLNMLDLFDDPRQRVLVDTMFYDKDLKRPLLAPGAAEAVLTKWRIIIDCRIETQFGRLRSSGVGHWVVIERIMKEGRGGLVEIYNPASNAMELYEWDCFVVSGKIPYGVIVMC